MAWTTPKSWASNEVVTAANMNSHLRDNMNWLANDKPRCQGNRTAAQSIPNTTDTAVAFNTADSYDVGAMHDTVTNNTRFTVPTGGDGLYQVEAWGDWAANATGTRALYLRTNGATIFWRDRRLSLGGIVDVFVSIAGSVQLAATDYVELIANHNAGAALDISDCHLSIRWVAF
jgi:hypothetical protein